MSADTIFKDKQACTAYVEEDEKVSMVTAKDREKWLGIVSHYLPDKDKVHVALGVGGGLDFRLLENIPHVVRRVGVDYSSYMLELCKERHPNVELVKDDLRKLEQLKKIAESERRPTIYTLLSNTLGNFEESEIRKGVVTAIGSVMKGDDLIVAELYKRPELLVTDAGLIPDFFLRARGRMIDLEKRQLSEPIPLVRLGPFDFALRNPQYAWLLQSYAQQEHYGELKAVQVAAGNMLHTDYTPETGNIVGYRLSDFKQVFTSHRWEGMEVASAFMDAGLLGSLLNGENTFTTLFVPYDGRDMEGFERHYTSLFY